VIVTDLSHSQQIRESLGHPVVDADAHYLELTEPFASFVRDHGAGDLMKGGYPFDLGNAWFWRPPGGGPEDLIRFHRPAPLHGVSSGNTDYFANTTIPHRYHDHLPEAGIDFAVLYPSMAFVLMDADDDERRVTLCKLFNEFLVEQFGPYSDRVTPAALVPMNTPEEAVDALDHIARLGLKVGCIPSFVPRAIPAFADAPDEYRRYLRRIDVFGIDSEYDYDPVWAKAIELGIPLGAHSTTWGFTERSSPTNLVYNQIGHFATSGEALVKALFLGGVTQRFPRLRVALLEGGVAHGVRMLSDLTTRWNTRRASVLRARDPRRLDADRLARIFAEEGGRFSQVDTSRLAAALAPPATEWGDDFSNLHLDSVDDIVDAYCNSFTWGCEGEDPLAILAFDPLLTPKGGEVSAVLGSDLGHYDVPDWSHPLAEAYEFVERGAMDTDQFRDFVFANSVRFHASPNPRFFEGTVVESEAAELLESTR
jgi:predicted TIM-barrel fold metal-dependent hydrolase